MKINNMSLIKDISISILVVLAILILVLTTFYNKLAINKVISNPTEYELKEELKNEIEKESEEQQYDVVVPYSINGKDLKSYEGTEKSDYDKDKLDPFERYEYSENGESNSSSNTNSNSASTNSTVNEEPKGIK